MNVIFVNHHLYQEGDAYGLIYALLLNIAEKVGDFELHALFYVDADRLDSDANYRAQVERRFGYFRSFGLLGPRVKLVMCRFNPDPNVLAFKVFAVGPWVLEVQCNGPLFKNNPRKVSLALTGEENDAGHERPRLVSWMLDTDFEKFGRALRLLLNAERQVVSLGPPANDAIELNYRYISYSTNYILRCVGSVGFERVTAALVDGVLGATGEYTEGNQAFLAAFTQALFEKKLKPEDRDENPLIILFWIRGAKADETAAIASRDAGTSVGKPQHHTNLTLYKQVRALVKTVSGALQRPVLIVPIGDELTEDHFFGEFKKGEKEHNLIRFFHRPEFAGKPMGAQMNFLTLMALRFRVVQVGMRSGSMERLMYLGVPSIYFDRTDAEQGLPPLVGATRIRQLCGLQDDHPAALTDYLLRILEYLKGGETWQKGFPYFFHVENRDTGFMRYSATMDTTIESTIQKLLAGLPGANAELRLAYNLFKTCQSLRIESDFVNVCKLRFGTLGGLAEPEAQRLALMLWFMDQTYPNYASLRTLRPDQVVKIRLDDFGRELVARKQQIEDEIARKRQQRANRTAPSEVDWDMGSLFDEPPT